MKQASKHEVKNKNAIYMRSSSGQRQSFGVSRFDRFKELKKPQSTEFNFDAEKHGAFNHHFYTAKRAAGFGYSTKTDFSTGPHTKAKQSPGQYKIPTRFELNRRAGYGYNFGVGRDGYKQVLLNNMSADKQVPGPGTYSPSHRLKEVNLKWTMRPMTQTISTGGFVPGPGEYSMEKASIDAKGNQTCSKYKSSGATRFDPPRTMTGSRSTSSLVPGPGQYDNYNSVNESGTYGVSKYGNSLVRSFGKGGRSSLARINGTPGPGNQETDSTFVGRELTGFNDSPDRTLNTTLQTEGSVRKNSKKRSASTERF